MKLTKAQQMIIDDAKRDVDYAREHDFLHWVSKNLCGYDLDRDWDAVPNPYLSNEFVLRNAQETIAEDETGNEYFEPFHWKKKYERQKEGECLTRANSRTLEALERIGLIEIIHDGRSNIDTIKLLNY